jgi:hypothetical protein
MVRGDPVSMRALAVIVRWALASRTSIVGRRIFPPAARLCSSRHGKACARVDRRAYPVNTM